MNAMTYARKASAPSAALALKIGRPDDAFEREADRAADEVMSGAGTAAQWSFSRIGIAPPLQRKCSCGGSGGSEGECEECKAKEALQRKPLGPVETGIAPPIVHEVLNSPGEPLDKATREFFEPRFGYDLSRVRIHTDESAAASAQSVRAAAYTVGSHIVFGKGRYKPKSEGGRFLLGHELTHAIQQTPVLARQPAPPHDPGGTATTQRAASKRLAEFATVIESYANRASGRVSGLGTGGDTNAIRRNIATARAGAAGLRKLAAKGDDHLAAGILTNFTPQRLKAASAKLVPATVPQPVSDISQAPPSVLAAKSLDISNPSDSAEIEADRVAREVITGRPPSLSVHSADLGVYRLVSEADLAQTEEELAGLEEITTTTEVTEAALAPEEIAVVTGVLAGIGPVGWAVIAVVVVVIAIGIWYVATEDSAEGQKKTAPTPAPAPSATPAPASAPAAKPVPKECADTANRLNTDKCKMTATTEHSGSDPVADLYCEQQTQDECEYRTRGASGTAFFDSVKGDTATECKCGLLDFVRDAKQGKRFAKGVLDDKIEQVRRHLRVVQDCGLKYRIIVSNDEVADWFRGELGDEVTVEVKKSEFCD
jgi:Domain of unknown function (DUF4157)